MKKRKKKYFILESNFKTKKIKSLKDFKVVKNNKIFWTKYKSKLAYIEENSNILGGMFKQKLLVDFSVCLQENQVFLF